MVCPPKIPPTGLCLAFECLTNVTASKFDCAAMGNTVGDVAGLGLRDAELAHLMNSDTIALIDANIDSTKAKQIAKALRQNRTGIPS